MEQNEIIDEIQMLHLAGMPLNISAVKRHSPGLVEAACAIRPYFGWRAALEAAGCPYGSIKVHLEATCACRICGMGVGILTTHLRRHGLTAKAYLERFPDAEMMSETIRAERTGKSDYCPDFEPLHTKEGILDRLHEYRRRNLPLSWRSVKQNDNGFAGATLKFFGSWDAALAAAQIDPAEIRLAKPGVSLSKEDVVARLKARADTGLPLHDSGVASDDLQLYNAARRRFGHYNVALQAAGIDPANVRRRIAKIPDEDKRMLTEAARQVAAMKGPERVAAAKRMHADFENVAWCCFGGWSRLADAIGVEPERLFEIRFPSRVFVIEELAERVRLRQSLRPSDVFDSDRTLYNAVLRHFGRFANLGPSLAARASDVTATLDRS